jgi:hypothetical protein
MKKIDIQSVIWNQKRTHVILNGTASVPWPGEGWWKPALLAWLADGNEIAEPPGPSAEALQRQLTAAVQKHLDAMARTRNYDGILSLCSYATSTDPVFAAEGQAGVNWRDAVWRSGYQILAAVQAGERQPPTAAELLAELPAMVWP